MLRKHDRGTMWLVWVCCLVVASATVAQADTLLGTKHMTGPAMSTSQDGSSPDGWGAWIEIGCKFHVMPLRYCPKPVEVIVPPWCQVRSHHHTALVPSGHEVGVVVDDGVPFKN